MRFCTGALAFYSGFLISNLPQPNRTFSLKRHVRKVPRPSWWFWKRTYLLNNNIDKPAAALDLELFKARRREIATGAAKARWERFERRASTPVALLNDAGRYRLPTTLKMPHHAAVSCPWREFRWRSPRIYVFSSLYPRKCKAMRMLLNANAAGIAKRETRRSRTPRSRRRSERCVICTSITSAIARNTNT